MISPTTKAQPLTHPPRAGQPLGDLTWFGQEIVVIANESTDVPEGFRLLGNYPNPFNPSTTLQFELPWAANVEVAVFDVLGREVLALPAQGFGSGVSAVQLDASGLASGLYLYRVSAVNADTRFTRTGRMVLSK